MDTNNRTSERERTTTYEECQAALTSAQQENADLKDKYLRAAAAIDNARKQAERDAANRVNQRLRSLFIRLLGAADNLERVLAHMPAGDEVRPGVAAALLEFQTALRQEGITPIAVEAGAAFDPQIHEAVTTEEGKVDQPTVAGTLRTGYLYEGQVLRPARVAVIVPARTSG